MYSGGMYARKSHKQWLSVAGLGMFRRGRDAAGREASKVRAGNDFKLREGEEGELYIN